MVKPVVPPCSAPRFVPALFTILLLIVAAAQPAAARRGAGSAVAIAGTVLDQEGRPASGVRIRFTDEGPVDAAAGPGPATLADAITDEDGRFEVTVDGSSDTYRFRVEGQGYQPYDSVVTLDPGESATLEITILAADVGRRSAAAEAYNAGAKAFNGGDLETARAEFERALELDPGLAEPHLALARVELLEGTSAEARESVDRYLALREDDTAALSLALVVSQKLGDWERSVELVDALVPHGSDAISAEIVFNQGAEAAERGDRTLALTRFRQAAELEPTLAAAHAGIAALAFNDGRYTEASEALDRLLVLDPEHVQGLRIRYLILTATGPAAAAAEALEPYLAADPDGAVKLLLEQAARLFEQGENAGAAALLEQVLELRPDHPQAHYSLGLCLTTVDPARARRHLERFLALSPDDPEAATAREILAYLRG